MKTIKEIRAEAEKIKALTYDDPEAIDEFNRFCDESQKALPRAVWEKTMSDVNIGRATSNEIIDELVKAIDVHRQQALSTVLEMFANLNHIELRSAEEMIIEDIGETQRAWLIIFLLLWDTTAP